MKKINLMGVLLTVCLCFLLIAQGCSKKNTPQAAKPRPHQVGNTSGTKNNTNSTASASNASGIEWVSSFEELEKKNKKAPKKVMIQAYTDWCGWCKKFSSTTMTHPQIASYVNQNFYALRLDGEGKNPITFKGKTYNPAPSGGKPTHEITREFLGTRIGYPSVIFLDEKLNKIETIPGYRDPQGFDAVLHYFTSNTYKKPGSLDGYLQTFQSEIKK